MTDKTIAHSIDTPWTPETYRGYRIRRSGQEFFRAYPLTEDLSDIFQRFRSVEATKAAINSTIEHRVMTAEEYRLVHPDASVRVSDIDFDGETITSEPTAPTFVITTSNHRVLHDDLDSPHKVAKLLRDNHLANELHFVCLKGGMLIKEADYWLDLYNEFAPWLKPDTNA